MNSEKKNSGNWNSGDWNSGDCNSGDSNSGGWNSGDRNLGECNSGCWNKSNYETGYFNNNDNKIIKVFNRPCKIRDWEIAIKPDFIFFELCEWVEDENGNGRFLTYTYQEAFKKSWDRASIEDKKLIFGLPNFDADVFSDISGISLDEINNLQNN